MTIMLDNLTNRQMILRALREELVGPSPQGQEIACAGDLHFDSFEEAYGPYRQSGSGEEILQRDPPTKRYGIGVLYPTGSDAATTEHSNSKVNSPDDAVASATSNENTETLVTDNASADIGRIPDHSSERGEQPDTEEFDITGANDYRPSVVGVSFLVEPPVGSVMAVQLTGGRYRRKPVTVGDRELYWWLRNPVSVRACFAFTAGGQVQPRRMETYSEERQGVDGLVISVEVYARPYRSGQFLVTVCAINRTPSSVAIDEACLFQVHMEATITTEDGTGCILPYPSAAAADLEEESLSLLYRNEHVFATGHGCSADWEGGVTGRACRVIAECLPVFKTPSITPTVARPDGSEVSVPMAMLAGIDPSNDGMTALEEVVALYEDWIGRREQEVPQLPSQLRPVGERHLDACRDCARKMRQGMDFLRSDSVAFRAFQLANHAVLLQQCRTRSEARTARYDARQRRLIFSEPYVDANPRTPPVGRGHWRAFQIAFLLLSLRSVADHTCDERETVELLWFPTGGGKTEAYLALAAFSIFLQRLRGDGQPGVNVLMRYTLRLLTAQQFQRAARLACAMEYLRSQQAEILGQKQTAIGIWVGTSTTPNKRADALAALRKLVGGGRYAENPFILDRCPWCGAQMGRPLEGQVRRGAPRVLGYEEHNGTVEFRCCDPLCYFSRGLPVYVIDEDIYDVLPAFIIGTVDKFAMLAWQPEARSIFGIARDGSRQAAPPSLIIQDELHLISGPLGSMVGLYETLVEELCTDRRITPPVRPKLVSSPATIRRYREQVHGLYARDSVCLFPPPGLEARDSFFARYATEPDGGLSPGLAYVGVHAPGLGSLQTVQVRTFSALLQAPVPLDRAARDPWWSLLLFFNSLRELGTTVSLFQSDIPDYLRVVRNRLGLDFQQVRRLHRILELTGRLPGEEVPKAISALEVSTQSNEQAPVDVCLASNIIEVGIDIDRLSLMAVVGQPKTTSQYIQVTGRVGRRWWERPGIVVTIYTASKPRDRSHFERFRAYHERLYAQVEPTSVTPFSRPAVDRALHAVIAAYARQAGSSRTADSPYPYPAELAQRIAEVVRERVALVDPQESASVERVLERRLQEWRLWERTVWQGRWDSENIPMLRESGGYASPEVARLTWPTPMSMRNVDAECQAEVTNLYLADGIGGASNA